MNYITEESLEVIATNPGKYAVEDTSVLSAKLQPWWTFVASKVPFFISANLVTVGAAFPLILSWILSSYYTFYGLLMPRALHVFCAFSVFFFQTMDAVDGKCARRYGTSSPLGDFLDHVMDSVSIMMCGFLLAHGLAFGSSHWIYFLMAACSLSFVVVHWESAKILVMKLDNGSSITEAQIGFVVLFLMAPIFGEEFWKISIYKFITLGRLAAGGLLIVISIMQCIKSLSRVHEKLGFGVFHELLVPICLQFIVATVWSIRFPDDFCVVPFEMFCVSVTVVHACAITINRLARQPINNMVILPMAVPAIVLPLFGEVFAWISGIWSLAFMLLFLIKIILAIAHKLNIPVFAQPANAKRD